MLRDGRLADSLRTTVLHVDRYEITPVSFDLPGAALATGLSVRELQRAIANSELTAHYRGTKPVIDREELQAFIRALPTERPRR